MRSTSPLREPGRSATTFSAPPTRAASTAAHPALPLSCANTSTSGWPMNVALKPGVGGKMDGSNGRKQRSRVSDAAIFGTRPLCHAHTCGHTTCTAGTPTPFAYAASFRFIPG